MNHEIDSQIITNSEWLILFFVMTSLHWLECGGCFNQRQASKIGLLPLAIWINLLTYIINHIINKNKISFVWQNADIDLYWCSWVCRTVLHMFSRNIHTHTPIKKKKRINNNYCYSCRCRHSWFYYIQSMLFRLIDSKR